MFKRFFRRLPGISRLALALLSGLLLCLPSTPVRAAGTVGNGTPASCTSTALAAAISAGSGTITFDCGTAPLIMVITQPGGLVIPTGVQITIDGDNKIELSGGLAWRVFVVHAGGSLTLKNLSIVKGYSSTDDGGAIRNDGTLTIMGCTFADNLTTAFWSGGAIVSYGPLTISSSQFHNNQAGNGGAVSLRLVAAITSISATTFDLNATTNPSNGWGGAILIRDGAHITLIQDNFHDNTARIFGGAIYVQAASILTVTGGTQFSSNSSQVSQSMGGAIYSQGTLGVTDSTFWANHAGNGGAIFMENGTTTIQRSTFTHNWAVSGGAYEQGAGILLATDSWFTGNGYDLNGSPVTLHGGALDTGGGSATLTSLTLSGNWADNGGGFYQSGTSVLQNVTISGNHSNRGGGISQFSGDITLTNVTLYQNSATIVAGGVVIDGGTSKVRNTIVADNTGGNCYATFSLADFNLSSDGTCSFGLGRINVTIRLMGLRNTGGFAPSHLPFAGSPAVDNASQLYCSAADQRRIQRAGKGAGCDVGSVERVPGELAPAFFLPLIKR